MDIGEVECTVCGRDFNCEYVDDSYHIQNANRTIMDSYPVHTECSFCRGEDVCGEPTCKEPANILDTESGDVYCDRHWKDWCEEAGMLKEEAEEFTVNLELDK